MGVFEGSQYSVCLVNSVEVFISIKAQSVYLSIRPDPTRPVPLGSPCAPFPRTQHTPKLRRRCSAHGIRDTT